jgi:trimethylamine--corrinoid protein Co-methyltransferase
MEGALVVQNADVLAGITLTQLIREGLPVIYGGQSTSAAMRYGTLSVGAPEMALNTAATAQLARFYQLPSRSGGAITDSKVCDSQAGWESMMGQLTATLYCTRPASLKPIWSPPMKSSSSMMRSAAFANASKRANG